MHLGENFIYFFFFNYLIGLGLYPVFRYFSILRGLLLLNIVNLSFLVFISIGMVVDVFLWGVSYSLEFISVSFWSFSLDISLSFVINSLSVLFSSLVLVIGLATNIYAINYFKGEADESLFMFWLNLFIGGMLVLVFSNNFFTLFLGWELIGLTSFFLINFWVARRGTLKSSFKAFAFNAISDVFLLLALINFFLATGTTNINGCVASVTLTYSSSAYYLGVGAVCLIVCASIKSVQLIGHLWLPDSMEAPVPASSLIHSATLVSAGVFLLLRFNSVISITYAYNLVLLLGSVSAAYGGVVAAAQTDLKKLLAYSTMGHCGFLYICVYFNNIYLIFVYLVLHGLFKAATFYCAGTFIRVFKTQDSRHMGGAARVLFFEAILLIVCAGNLGGLPLFIGYFYKLFFFKLLLNSYVYAVPVGLIVVGMLSSVVYVWRIVYFSCFDFIKGSAFRLIYFVQGAGVRVAKWFTNSTDISLLGVFVLLIFAVFTVIFVTYCYYYFSIETDLSYAGYFLSLDVTDKFAQLYSSYLVIFYFIYLMLTLLLIFLCNRYNFLILQSYAVWASILFFLSISCIILVRVWGHIMIEAVNINNFNFGFSTSKSEILLHLSQWQYWWWFWFALLWSLYFFFIIRTISKRVFYLNPAINSSIRGHGKWGDFLVALIPLSWCGNILVNSNFILRMIEWQNEGSLFTLRVQGKQWYWVYKFDSTLYSQLSTRALNVGRGRWIINNAKFSSNRYLSEELLNLSSQNEFLSSYSKLLQDSGLVNRTLTAGSSASSAQLQALDVPQSGEYINIAGFTPVIDDTSNFAANIIQSTKQTPMRLTKAPLNMYILDTLQTTKPRSLLFIKPIFFFDFWSLEEKQVDSELFWGFRQKKYKRVNTFPVGKAILLNYQLNINDLRLGSAYKALKYSRNRGELVPVTLARRLLRTRRTLVLPAHTNITVITNSYDVVHSWFIPGLGLKLDCVPGRSTHHTFYIDNIGFYYGQCAEICGRYHHHMPVRLCALPIEQFILWWQHKGLARSLRLS